MVDASGHAAFGLLFAVPAWFVWDDRASATFVVLTALAALVPDVDVWLAALFPAEIHHHGVVHTVVFLAAASLVAAALFAALFGGRLDSWLRSERFDRTGTFVYLLAAFLLGTMSHLFADMLSAPDISTPIEPFWPFFDKPWSVDVVWYDATWINLGFLVAMVITHAVLAYVTTPADHRYRLLSR